MILPSSVRIGRDDLAERRVARARQVIGLMDDLRKWTEPSAKSMFAPPGCMLQ